MSVRLCFRLLKQGPIYFVMSERHAILVLVCVVSARTRGIVRIAKGTPHFRQKTVNYSEVRSGRIRAVNSTY